MHPRLPGENEKILKYLYLWEEELSRGPPLQTDVPDEIVYVPLKMLDGNNMKIRIFQVSSSGTPKRCFEEGLFMLKIRGKPENKH